MSTEEFKTKGLYLDSSNIACTLDSILSVKKCWELIKNLLKVFNQSKLVQSFNRSNSIGQIFEMPKIMMQWVEVL